MRRDEMRGDKMGLEEMMGGDEMEMSRKGPTQLKIGPSRTKKMIIGGEIENANALLQWGFIDELFKDEDLDKKTVSIAKKYSLKPALPSQMIKRSVNALTYQNDQAIMHMDYDQFLLSREFHKA